MANVVALTVKLYAGEVLVAESDDVTLWLESLETIKAAAATEEFRAAETSTSGE